MHYALEVRSKRVLQKKRRKSAGRSLLSLKRKSIGEGRSEFNLGYETEFNDFFDIY